MTITLGRTTLVRGALLAALVLLLAGLLPALHGDGGEPAVAAVAANDPISGRCTGAQQGVIKGDTTTKGREGTYAITSLTHGLDVPFDGTSGAATGRLTHEPVVIRTDVSSATPLLLQALTRHELLTSCTFRFWRTDAKGVSRNYFRLDLTDAYLVSYRLVGRPGGDDQVVFSLVYGSVQWTWTESGVTTGAEWGQEQ
ncbi:type VI secretion system tube protein TssD [Nocardioides sp. GY 10127]|uniref:type VI secretion system tube protein TssD n=1 Tax=Nocardioides sp. GY 10127 TaxID=2569762 RepID=UPI0010A88563|nr:type VI secretion system tube protein TssD [Nocardioides sp. GY 10127]TIC84373.1 type VI secretion system tube protein Hcp [Nocardioides sp. GY 10127]